MAYYALVLFIFSSFSAYAASCCGGGGGSLPLIIADNRSEFSIVYTNKAYIYDVDPQGVLTKRDGSLQEIEEGINLSQSYLFDNYFQVSAQLGLTTITKKTSTIEESSSGLSDLKLSVANEFVKEDYFSAWRPRGFVYFSSIIPLENSKHDSESTLQTDTASAGFYSAAFGLSLIKNIKLFDVSFDSSFSLHKEEDFVRISGEEIKVERKPSFSSSFDLGYNFSSASPWRIGLGTAYSYTGKEIVNLNGKDQHTSSVKIWTGSLSVAYMDNRNNSYSLSYSDQTIFAQSINASLSKSLSAKVTFKNPL